MNEQDTAGTQANGPQVVYVPAPPEKPTSWFRRHKILTTLGAVAVVVVAAQLGGGGDEAPGGVAAQPSGSAGQDASGVANDDSPGSSPEPDDPAEPGIGDAARDGKFEFTVSEVEDGVESVGTDMFGERAQGQFVLVHVKVLNIGDEAQYFLDSNQTLVDTEGRKHSADSSAGIYLEDSSTFAEEINPGNSLEGILVFDLPKDAVPASIELHDSAFSGGVTVLLG